MVDGAEAGVWPPPSQVPNGGERAAVMYSLIGSAKLNGLDPELYLRHVLAQIADYRISRIEDILPWNLAPSLQARSSQVA
jgi:hypothetical protein